MDQRARGFGKMMDIERLRSAGSLRWWFALHVVVVVMVDEGRYKSRTRSAMDQPPTSP
jgi:hypothetical protein